MVGSASELVLVGAVAAVGVLHTLVPDHWVPIAVVARQAGWTKRQTARAAFVAGLGHTISTLLIGAVVWLAGTFAAQRFGHAVSLASSAALIAFGLWVTFGALRELTQANGAAATAGHRHMHRHADGAEHSHYHLHEPRTHHAVEGTLALAPQHEHEHNPSRRTALLLALGSSPMLEGIPAFLAASRYGPGLLGIMAAVFAAGTIATYTVLCIYAREGLERIHMGPVERYGEALSGGVIALVGLAFFFLPAA